MVALDKLGVMRHRFATAAALARALALAAALSLVAAGCGGSSSSSGSSGSSAGGAAPAAVVQIHNLSFQPGTVTIGKGETVQWAFEDAGITHNVIGDGGLHSPDQISGSYSHTFTRSGTFNYQCSLHAGMTGTVVVQ